MVHLLSSPTRRLTCLLLLLALFTLSGCQWLVDFDRSLIIDAGPDAGAPMDAGTDAGSDAGSDAGP